MNNSDEKSFKELALASVTKNQAGIYKTRDLAEAAALIVFKQSISSIERDRHICWFVFENHKECEKLSNQFFFGELKVNAREYHEALSRLKSRIFASA